ncbi:MAG: hypothetical protein HPY79_02820 [Bacteroidales bacterium]|nr:hypothetical protein [Bacteroidales bacterium]
MKTFVLIMLAIVAFGITSAQKSIDLSIKTDNGNLFKQDADIYTMPTIKILGLKTDAEFKNLEKSILADPYVAKFQYLDNAEPDGARKALLSFKGNDEKTIVNFFKSINVNNIIINDKTFSVNQIEEIKTYVRELKAKKKAERDAIPSKKRVSDPNE